MRGLSFASKRVHAQLNSAPRASDAPGVRLERRAFCPSFQDALENVSLRIRAKRDGRSADDVIDLDEEDAEEGTLGDEQDDGESCSWRLNAPPTKAGLQLRMLSASSQICQGT